MEDAPKQRFDRTFPCSLILRTDNFLGYKCGGG
jgi:hypothetical protein